MRVILRPIITEKATNDSELNNRYAFFVDTKSNKIEIKKAIQSMYNVDVLSVKTMVYAPKVKSRYTKSGLQVGATNKMKKAIVEIAEGQEIDLYGNI